MSMQIERTQIGNYKQHTYHAVSSHMVNGNMQMQPGVHNQADTRVAGSNRYTDEDSNRLLQAGLTQTVQTRIKIWKTCGYKTA